MLNIKTVPVGIYEENCYILVDEDTKDCAIIDAGEEAGKIENEIKSMGGKPKYLILTHGHFDHVGAVEEICSKYSIPFYMPETQYRFRSF